MNKSFNKEIEIINETENENEEEKAEKNQPLKPI